MGRKRPSALYHPNVRFRGKAAVQFAEIEDFKGPVSASTGHSVRKFACYSLADALTPRRLDNLFSEADLFEQLDKAGILADEIVGRVDFHGEQAANAGVALVRTL